MPLSPPKFAFGLHQTGGSRDPRSIDGAGCSRCTQADTLFRDFNGKPMPGIVKAIGYTDTHHRVGRWYWPKRTCSIEPHPEFQA
jgi:hypothetical protein